MEKKSETSLVRPKIRNHYVPKFYLSGFSDPHNPPYVWMYDKRSTDVRKTTVENIAVRNYYYSFIDEKGVKDSQSFENALSHLESQAAPVFRDIQGKEPLEKEKRVIFAVFLALMMTRVPAFREDTEQATGKMVEHIGRTIASDSKAFRQWIKKFQRETGTDIQMPVAELRKLFLQRDWEVRTDPQTSLAMIPEIAEPLVGILLKMRWAFLEGRGYQKFVTSDNPAFHLNRIRPLDLTRGMGLWDKNVEVTFPVSKDQVFFGTWNGASGYGTIDNASVKAINRRTVIMSLRFVFGSQCSKGLQSLVQKYKGAGVKLKVSTIGPYIVAQRVIESGRKKGFTDFEQRQVVIRLAKE